MLYTGETKGMDVNMCYCPGYLQLSKNEGLVKVHIVGIPFDPFLIK